MKTHGLGCLFNKAVALQVYNFIKKKLQHKCFPVIIAKFLRIIPNLKNICERLLLFIRKICWSIRIVSEKYASRESLSLQRKMLFTRKISYVKKNLGLLRKYEN